MKEKLTVGEEIAAWWGSSTHNSSYVDWTHLARKIDAALADTMRDNQRLKKAINQWAQTRAEDAEDYMIALARRGERGGVDIDELDKKHGA